MANITDRAGFAALALVVLLAGCATPDFGPFANETASLASAIATEQAEVASHFALIKAKAETRDADDPRVNRLAQEQARYSANTKAIDAVMQAAVQYSSTLVDLAAAGETGPAAVDSLTGSLKGLSSGLNAAISALPTWAVNLAKEIAQDITRIEAQRDLAAATQQAVPAVRRIGEVISELYAWPNGDQALITAGLQATEEGVLRDLIGKNRIAFYKGMNVDVIQPPSMQSRQTRLEWYFGDLDDRIANQNTARGICDISAQNAGANCLTGQTAQSLSAAMNIIAGIEPQFQTYVRDLASSRKWLEQRKEVSLPITEAARVWAKEHEKLASALEKCGGWHLTRKACGNLTFANLKLSAERLKALAGKGGQ